MPGLLTRWRNGDISMYTVYHGAPFFPLSSLFIATTSCTRGMHTHNAPSPSLALSPLLPRIVDDIAWVKRTVNRRFAKGHGYYLQHGKETCLVGLKVREHVLSLDLPLDLSFSLSFSLSLSHFALSFDSHSTHHIPLSAGRAAQGHQC
eukprot:TRINITY_DN2972_c0_g4_i1.p1 TRINITY_DN2972_c0_g4~~TRINITY_DN2972_c0_g4_i1.p1  ORF type:complete len:148 (-),score=10.85 TRINITY_DN2972_c0_g4_i1:325-768(-)